MSLLEPDKQSNDLYLNPIFDSTQTWCWSADRLPEGEQGSSESAWIVDFNYGIVDWLILRSYYVRAVRS